MIEVYFDGACEPRNPGGNMGFGVFIKDDGKEIFSYAGYKEASQSNTSNVAEYMALLEALKFLVSKNKTDSNILVRGDSMLVIKQMSGQWRIKSGAYVSYAKECLELSSKLKKISYKWIPRDLNAICDELSKQKLTDNNISITVRTKGSRNYVAPKSTIGHPKITHETPMPFGVHKGKMMIGLPTSYLKWLNEQEWCSQAIKDYVVENLKDRNANEK